MINNIKWQAPGNGKAFDSSLELWRQNQMSCRSIGVLQFILSHNNNVSIKFFEEHIKEYLLINYQHQKNNSIARHFYRPLEFIGLIRNFNGYLSVSIDGRNFLNTLLNNDFKKAKEYYILQMLKTKYPNSATPDVKLNLFPFRIIFKLLIDKSIIDKDDFNTKIPYITNLKHIINYDNFSSKNPYYKINTWIISYLIKWNILELNKNQISLNYDIKNFLQPILNNMPYEEMFFKNDAISPDNINLITNKIDVVKRDANLINDVIKEENYKCFINPSHITFRSLNRINYVEGHHIIPISLQKSFTQNLDCKDNIIPLCPNCHKAMHLGIEDVKIQYIETILSKQQKLLNFNINKNDLLEIYI